MNIKKALNLIFLLGIIQTIGFAVWGYYLISEIDISAGLGVFVFGTIIGTAILYMLIFLAFLAWYSKRDGIKPNFILIIILDLIPLAFLYYILVWSIDM